MSPAIYRLQSSQTVPAPSPVRTATEVYTMRRPSTRDQWMISPDLLLSPSDANSARPPSCSICQVQIKSPRWSPSPCPGISFSRTRPRSRRSRFPPPQITAMQSSFCHYHYPFVTLHHIMMQSSAKEDPKVASLRQACCRHNLVIPRRSREQAPLSEREAYNKATAPAEGSLLLLLCREPACHVFHMLGMA